MNIIGNGVDIIENKRIASSLKLKGFVSRIFTKNEIIQSKKIKNKTNYFAKRFAAKEAFIKAIGIGFRNNINFKDIEIKNNRKGKPLINISKNIKKYDGFIALGCVIKGETPHFDFISKAATDAIMKLSIDNKKPIGNGIITCLNRDQAVVRSKSKGQEAANAVLSVLKNF